MIDTTMAQRPCSLAMYPWPTDPLHTVWAWFVHQWRETTGECLASTLSAPLDYLAHWLAPDLLLAQACGYPASTLLRDHIQIVGAFHYDISGCESYHYRSVILVRQEDMHRPWHQWPQHHRAAINEPHSQSGYHALMQAFREQADDLVFPSIVCTGSHRASAQAVARGDADIASLDIVSAHWLSQQEPDTFAQLAVLSTTPLMPGLPLITSAATSQHDLSHLRDLWHRAIHEPSLRAAWQALRIHGFTALSAQDYACCAERAHALPSTTRQI